MFSKIIRSGSLNPFLDIHGTPSALDTLDLNDEVNGDSPTLTDGVNLIRGDSCDILSNVNGVMHISGLNLLLNQPGNLFFIKIISAGDVNNTGYFKIINFLSATECLVKTTTDSITPDIGLNWSQHLPYSLQTDINYARTDRAHIKGARFYSEIPTYYRPDNTTLTVAANLTNIAGKTTDARGFIGDKIGYNIPVFDGYNLITYSLTNCLKHSNGIDYTGIPCFDFGPYFGHFKSCFVEILDGYSDSILTVPSGPHIGEKIFAISQEGNAISPNSIEFLFYSVPFGSDLQLYSTPYTWNLGTKNLTVVYGFYKRLDLLPDDYFKKTISPNVKPGTISNFISGPSNGITEDQHAKLRQLIHLESESGPMEGFSSGAFREILPFGSPFPNSIIWYEDNTKIKKIVEKNIVRNSVQMPTVIEYMVYDINGMLLHKISDTLNYSNSIFETNRTRNIIL